MNIILASTSTLFGGNYLEYLKAEIISLYQNIDEIIFIPFARPGGISHDGYTGDFAKNVHQFSFQTVHPAFYHPVLMES